MKYNKLTIHNFNFFFLKSNLFGSILSRKWALTHLTSWWMVSNEIPQLLYFRINNYNYYKHCMVFLLKPKQNQPNWCQVKTHHLDLSGHENQPILIKVKSYSQKHLVQRCKPRDLFCVTRFRYISIIMHLDEAIVNLGLTFIHRIGPVFVNAWNYSTPAYSLT